jgi:hypothetical protein
MASKRVNARAKFDRHFSCKLLPGSIHVGAGHMPGMAALCEVTGLNKVFHSVTKLKPNRFAFL